MAATLAIKQNIKITGLGGGDDERNYGFTDSNVPTEVVQGKPIIGNSAISLDLGNIAAGSACCLYLEAISGNVYVTLGSADATPSATLSHLYLLAGTACILPLNPNATAMPGVRLLGSATSAQIQYILVGK